MNANDVMLTERTTAHTGSRAGDYVPDAPTLPFDYSLVVRALPDLVAGTGGTPYMLTIAAQLAAMLRARIGSGELAPSQPIPGESTLMRQYGVARGTARRAVRALAAEGLVYVVPGRGAYVAARD
ncbi:MAG TPA: winged helix-turn-helix domain-containing protein [Streptosporangiaceae bacterium]